MLTARWKGGEYTTQVPLAFSGDRQVSASAHHILPLTEKLTTDVLHILFGSPIANDGRGSQVSPQVLAKCIWPAEYGVALVWRQQARRQRQSDKVVGDVKTGKTPKRLLAVLPLLSQMIANCGGLDASGILSHICPSTVRSAPNRRRP